ncbi:histidine phosphatase family protein [Brasilonema sp. UFV-L1]|uniref:histidine phosphatase family protein n=1 Tax=Brasilonema sp. UFV-L1 TaxID=2234130 RepID=UPI00145F62D7|nr:histidine phosphatase family protein [Brasilonema sp. UFV-L1]NMG07573.1 histidine phosphatase family protein [Brasilonema sp. UFV-L1]
MRSNFREYQETRVILVRHGQSTYNALGLYQGSSDESVLTEVGRSDARKTGAFLKGLAFDAIYSSSLRRSHETAKEMLGIIAPHINPNTILVTDKLRETDMPAWQGLAFQYVRETFPQEYRLWKQRPDEFRMEIPPNLTQKSQRYIYPALNLYERVQQFWQEVLPRYIGKTLLLVTHGGTNRALISTALGISPNYYHCIQQSNCGISILNFANGSLESGQLEVMNLSSHVGEDLPKPQEGGKGLRLLLVPSNATAEQTENLAELLKDVNIEFSLSSIFDTSQEMTQQILQYHPETVQLEVLREDFPEVWQDVINTKSLANSHQLMTGLVIASKEILKRLICQAIGMSSDKIERLQVREGTISCIQYPGSHHPPILQAMNRPFLKTKYLNIKPQINLALKRSI